MILFPDRWAEPRLLSEAQDRVGDADGERHLPEQEAGGVRGQRHAETHRGDAVQPAGQYVEIFYCNIQNAGNYSSQGSLLKTLWFN